MNFKSRFWTFAIAFAFFVNFVTCIFVAVRMPVFNHVDEEAHFDYALKLSKGIALTDGMSVEPETHKLWRENLATANHRYMASEYSSVNEPPHVSHELMQPRVIYSVSGLMLRLGEMFHLTLTQQLLMLRIMCVLLVLAAKVMVFRAIYEIWRPAGLLALAHLAAMIPTDLLRFSNDTPATAIGAGIALLLVLSIKRHRWQYTAGLAVLLSAAAFTKLTALLFLGALIVTVHLVFMKRDQKRMTLYQLLGIYIPAGICTLLVAYYNYRFSGSITGMSGGGSTTAEGLMFTQRAISTFAWQWWHQELFTIETLIGGLRGADVYPVYIITTWIVLGQALAFGWVIFGSSTVEFQTDESNLRDSVPPHLKRWITAGLLSLLAVQAVTVLILAFVGKIWVTGRMLVPMEAWPLFTACCGYVLVIQRLKSPIKRRVSYIAIGAVVLIPWLVAARMYLRFRGYY